MKAALLAIALLPLPALAGNFATCLLDKLPAVQNDIAAHAAYQACTGAFPGGLTSVPQGTGRGWFSYKTGADCTLKKAGDTRSNRAAGLIGVACRKLYDEAPPGLKPYDGPVTPLEPTQR